MKKIKNIAFEYFQITLGCFIGSLGLTMFLVPNKVAAGGVSGLATVFHYVTGAPVGWTMLAMNIPLLILGVVFLGKVFGVKTLVGSVLFSVFTELTASFPVLTYNIMLSTVYGGLVLGLGLGIVFKAGGSTGGSDLAAILINHFMPSVSIGKGVMLVDFFVIALVGLTFDWELALYSWISLFISGKVIDLIQEGANYAKAIYIISKETENIASSIMKEMGRGVTCLGGYGGYTRENKDVLLCIVSRLEVPMIKEIVEKHDSKAFVIISDVHEVLGEGFTFESQDVSN